MAGPLEVKFKAGAFASWSDSFVRLQGRWLCVYKRIDDSVRQGAIELGPGVSVTDISNPEACAKFPRRFDITCHGGLLSKTEMNFRTKSRKDRDQWVQAIVSNLDILTSPLGQHAAFGVQDAALLANQMWHDVTQHPIRIRADLRVRCAYGESIVTFLVTQGMAPDRPSATAFGQYLVTMNVLHHVMWDRDFTDSAEPFVIVSPENTDVETPLLDEEDDYHVAHFLKYMDSRKFWKYIGPSENALEQSATTTGSNVSSGSRRALFHLTTPFDRSTSSSDSERGGSVILASLDDRARSSVPFTKEGKPKQCVVCTKWFNPLRRRHRCRQCRASICSNCSVIRKYVTGTAPEGVPVSSRICICCKLSNADVRDDTPSSQRTRNSHRSTGNDKRWRREGSRCDPDDPQAVCHHCRNENCMPVTEYARISYPVKPASIAFEFVIAKRLDNEVERLRSVQSLLVTIASTPSATRVLRQFSNMAAIASHCPMVVIGLLDSDHYVLGSQLGVDLGIAVPRNESFAAHTCRSGTSLVCADLGQDIRFVKNPWRQEGLKNAAFYAGIPLTLSNGHIVGALEVFDTQSRLECGQVLIQLETVVRGLVNLFEEILAAATEAQRVKDEAQAVHDKQAQEHAAMEAQLLQLLSQTTSTQEQIRTQQTHMASAIQNHSKQIGNLAEQIERIEATLAAKLSSKGQADDVKDSP